MFPPDQYSLLDFGSGRKLERFGGVLVDRPSPPAAPFVPAACGVWTQADLRFEEDAGGKEGASGRRGRWIPLTERGEKAAGESWPIRHENAALVLELKGSPFGHLGVFPEQSRNWDAIAAACRDGKKRLGRPLRVLNLFAYTGGSSLAAASGGAEVTHLDAAQNIVRQARRNAELSGLAGHPIRWIADDAVKFVRREKKRGTVYDGIILDPPTYGHGARGEVWRLTRDLPGLLDDLFAILADDAPFVLLTCHSPGFDALRLRSLLAERMRGHFPDGTRIESGPIPLFSEQKRRLPGGDMAFIKR